MDPWMDAAHRGVTALTERGPDMLQAAGPIQAKGLHGGPEAPVTLTGQGGGATGPRPIPTPLDTSVRQQSLQDPALNCLGVGHAASRVVQRQHYGEEDDELHQSLIERYRAAMDLPQGGIDPTTGQQIGPSDAELKYGGPLLAWLQTQPRTSGDGAASSPMAQMPSWESERERMLHLVMQGDVQQAGTILGGLIRRAGEGITPPAPLQPRAIGRLRLNLGAGGRSTSARTTDVAGGADPRWAFREPDDYWRWIEFRAGFIGETEAYTRSAILHELQHCADLERDRQHFLQGPEPHTEDHFVYYVRTHSGTRERHTEIYAQQATDTAFAEWQSGDRLDWLSGVLTELPLQVSRDQRLPIEHRIERFYQEAAPADRSAIMREFIAATSESIRQSHGNEDALRILYGRTRTILDHFPNIWQAEGRTHEIIEDNLERNIPARLRGPVAH
jgi:hypothetical protein